MSAMLSSQLVLQALTLFYIVISVQSSYANKSKTWYPPLEPQFPPMNITIMKNSKREDQKDKSGRIFNFSDKENEINVELGFTIPFITIPVSSENGKRPLVNVNVGAITAGTILTTAALIFIPTAFSGLEPEISFGRSESREKRSGFLSRMDKAFLDHNIDPSICIQKAVCWTVKSAASKVTTGKGSSMDKIIDGISSNTLLERLVHGTTVQAAIHNGREDKDCNTIYTKCPITSDSLQQIAHNFMIGIV